MIVESAKRLLGKLPDFDVIFCAETKGTPLAYEISRQSVKNCIIAHKSVKMYMNDTIEVVVKSIMAENKKKFYLSSEKIDSLKGKRVLIIDNVIGTSESLNDLEFIVEKAGGTSAAKAAVFADSDAVMNGGIICLKQLI